MSPPSDERDEVDDDPFAKVNPADFPTFGPEDAAVERPKSAFPDSLRALLTPLAAMFQLSLSFFLILLTKLGF